MVKFVVRAAVEVPVKVPVKRNELSLRQTGNGTELAVNGRTLLIFDNDTGHIRVNGWNQWGPKHGLSTNGDRPIFYDYHDTPIKQG